MELVSPIKTNMKKILLSSSIIVFTLGALAVGSTGAFFSDSETSVGNVLTAGAIDLKIDNSSYYNGVLSPSTSWLSTNLTIEKFFDFLDLKPSDYGEDTISLHVDNNDSYLCADITLTSNLDNTQNDAESADDPNGLAEGELADNVNFIWWADDGDNVLEDDEGVISQGPIGALTLNATSTVTLADSQNNIWTDAPGPVQGGDTYYIGKAWCFGDIGASALTQDGSGDLRNPSLDNDGVNGAGRPEDGGYSCSGANLDNSTQTDSLTANVSFTAIQARHNSTFMCVPERPPVLQACTLPSTQKWADSVVWAGQGLRKNGTAVLPDRSNTSSVLGIAETTGTPTDVGFPDGSFFSLGFPNQVSTSSIVVSFDDNVILDEAGADLRIYEVTGGSYPDEHIRVEVSQDGNVWNLVAGDAVRDEDIDISPLPWVKYVRISDITNPAAFEATADAYDLDAVEALHCGEFAQPIVQQ